MVSAKTAGKVKPSTAEASKKSKKKSNKSANKHDDPFAVDGRVWKTVDVGDELLVGAEHGGFMGLEVCVACACWLCYGLCAHPSMLSYIGA